MIAWWWAVIAWVVGELMGFFTIIICMGSGDKTKEQERKQLEQAGLLFPENKKAADAATSTAAREPGRKDFFL